MKILAIRVAECARFVEPVALEGLTGGLDVFVGPNETGKSTLLKALDAVLFKQHTSMSKDVVALRPYGGGAPLVEVEFERGGERWRLAKRFLNEKSAELRSLSSGSLARGSDAETQLADLLGTGKDRKDGTFSLLWLRQGDLIEEDRVCATLEAGREDLHRAVEGQIVDAGGGARLRRVSGTISERLAELVVKNGSPRKGRYKDAIDAAERSAARAREVLAKVGASENYLAQLADLEAKWREVDEATAQARRRDRLARADAALKEASEAASRLERAKTVRAELRSAFDTAKAAAEKLARAIEDEARLVADIERETNAGQALAARQETAAAALAGAREAVAAAKADLTAIEAKLAAAKASEKRQELTKRLAKARALATEIAAKRAEHVKLPSDGAVLREAQRLARSIGEGAARLEAASAAITIAYLPGATGRILADGRVLADGERLHSAKPVTLEIPGLGRITVEPGVSRDRELVAGQLASERAALQAILDGAGIGDLAAYEDAQRLAAGIAGELQVSAAALAAWAPAGIGAIEAELAGLPLPSEAGEPEGATTLAAERERMLARLAAAQSQERDGQAAVSAFAEDAARRHGDVAARQRRLAELRADLPSQDLRRVRLETAQSQAQAAETAFNDALQLVSGLEPKAPTAEALDRMQGELDAADKDIKRAADERAALGQERARIEGALGHLHESDLGLEREAADAEAARATATLAELQEEVAALQLIAELAGAEEAALKARYLEPVEARVRPYLELVFPGGGVELDERFGVASVVRGAGAEPVANLSDGTREQIAVLVRLGFARLLAETGESVPLVLDDALVYSDDARLATMHEALELASLRHQVLVMTCRQQAFARLKGNRASLVAWERQKPRIAGRRVAVLSQG